MQSGTPTHVGANIFNCCICYRRDIRRQYTDLDDVQRVGIIVDRAPQHKGPAVDAYIITTRTDGEGPELVLEYIEDGMTSIYQPGDVDFNRPLKSRFKQRVDAVRQRKRELQSDTRKPDIKVSLPH
eukprot:GHVU01086615.1.p1 GENE.GHVU01086615.1~~GHVU01086615.1.p1  ORF type:complete len:126 (+),score=12.24 GHVU01086615.1:160-537(+)